MHLIMPDTSLKKESQCLESEALNIFIRLAEKKLLRSSLVWGVKGSLEVFNEAALQFPNFAHQKMHLDQKYVDDLTELVRVKSLTLKDLYLAVSNPKAFLKHYAEPITGIHSYDPLDFNAFQLEVNDFKNYFPDSAFNTATVGDAWALKIGEALRGCKPGSDILEAFSRSEHSITFDNMRLYADYHRAMAAVCPEYDILANRLLGGKEIATFHSNLQKAYKLIPVNARQTVDSALHKHFGCGIWYFKRPLPAFPRIPDSTSVLG